MAAGTARGMKGGHWLTTERGWCKAGSIMQVSEGVYCKTTRGDTDHPAYSAGSSTSYPDQRGCVTGFGTAILFPRNFIMEPAAAD